MKQLINGIVCITLLMGTVWAKEKAKEVKAVSTSVQKHIVGDIEIFTSENGDGKVTPKTIEKAFLKAGFTVSANRDMNKPFKIQFKETGFDVYNLFTFYQKEAVLELVKKYPNVGLFAPMSMSIYTKKGEKKISVASLSATAMAKIMHVSKDDKTLSTLKVLIQNTLKSAMPNGYYEALPYVPKEPKGNLVTHFKMEIDPKDWEDELEEFKMGFEGELAPNGFVIAGFNNLGDDFEEEKYEVYDFYEVYSICKLPVIYTIAKTHPEAGAYAPCSLYLSKKKGEGVMQIAFPSVYNWMSSMGLEDVNDIKILETAQAGMKKILRGLTE